MEASLNLAMVNKPRNAYLRALSPHQNIIPKADLGALTRIKLDMPPKLLPPHRHQKYHLNTILPKPTHTWPPKPISTKLPHSQNATTTYLRELD
jgi:hypothetical protein